MGKKKKNIEEKSSQISPNRYEKYAIGIVLSNLHFSEKLSRLETVLKLNENKKYLGRPESYIFDTIQNIIDDPVFSKLVHVEKNLERRKISLQTNGVLSKYTDSLFYRKMSEETYNWVFYTPMDELEKYFASTDKQQTEDQ
jgi:hypothetical protein